MMNDRESEVIEMYRDGLSLREVAGNMKMSHEGVRQVLLRHGEMIREPHRWHKDVDAAGNNQL